MHDPTVLDHIFHRTIYQNERKRSQCCQERTRFQSVVVFVLFLGLILITGIRRVAQQIDQGESTAVSPTISVDADITELEFGKWRSFDGKDGLGRKGKWFEGTAKNVGKTKAESHSYKVTTFDASGVKLEESGIAISFPDLNPGETGKIQVRFDEASKVIISKRK
jgi:hypothetical protein